MGRMVPSTGLGHLKRLADFKSDPIKATSKLVNKTNTRDNNKERTHRTLVQVVKCQTRLASVFDKVLRKAKYLFVYFFNVTFHVSKPRQWQQSNR